MWFKDTLGWNRIYYEQLNKLIEHWVLDLSIHDRELVAYQTCTCRTNLQCLPVPTMSSYSPISGLVDKEQYGTNGKTEKTKILCPPIFGGIKIRILSTDHQESGPLCISCTGWAVTPWFHISPSEFPLSSPWPLWLAAIISTYKLKIDVLLGHSKHVQVHIQM